MLVCPELSTTQNRSIAQLLPQKSMGYVSACEVTASYPIPHGTIL